MDLCLDPAVVEIEEAETVAAGTVVVEIAEVGVEKSPAVDYSAMILSTKGSH